MDFNNIKVIASDIDGTFVDDNKKPLFSTIESIKKIKDNNMLFILCSGREATTIKKLTKQWNIENYVDIIIGCGGAQIIDNIKNIEYSTFYLNENAIKDIVKFYKNENINFGIPDKGKLYFPYENKFVKMLSEHDHMEGIVVDFDQYLNQPKAKIMLVCDENEMENVINKSKTFKSDYYNGTPLRTGKNLFEYMNENVSKHKGLEIALQKHNLSLENICAFGDADNDYDMLLHSKIGVAMQNGSAKTKAIANFITDDNKNNGIANFLNKYLFKN